MDRPHDLAATSIAPAAVIVAHNFLPHIGGMEEVIRAQASSLRAQGHPVTVMTTKYGHGSLRRETMGGFRVRRVRATHVVERRFGIPYPLVSPAILWTLAREMRRARIIHLHEVLYLPTQLAFLVAVLLRRRYFLTQHVALVDHPNRLVTGVQRAVYATIGRAMLRRAQRVVVYNAGVRDFVLKLGVDPTNVTMTHNGIDTEFFRPAEPQEKAELRRQYGLAIDAPLALFAGRLVPKKGPDIAAAAAGDDFTVLIVGEGTGVRIGERPGVVAFGTANREQMRDLYRLADVFVFPAIGEIFTLVMQEAMASGLPVVTYDDPAYREYDVDRELVSFVDRTPDAVRAAVKRVLETPQLSKRMSHYSRALAIARFSWRANYPTEYAIYAGGTGAR